MAGKKQSGTLYSFKLITGYMAYGRLQTHGNMRPATRDDALAAQKDPRTKKDSQYVMIVLLSRIVENIGSLKDINVEVIESLDDKDFKCLCDTYQKMRKAEARH